MEQIMHNYEQQQHHHPYYSSIQTQSFDDFELLSLSNPDFADRRPKQDQQQQQPSHHHQPQQHQIYNQADRYFESMTEREVYLKDHQYIDDRAAVAATSAANGDEICPTSSDDETKSTGAIHQQIQQSQPQNSFWMSQHQQQLAAQQMQQKMYNDTTAVNPYSYTPHYAQFCNEQQQQQQQQQMQLQRHIQLQLQLQMQRGNALQENPNQYSNLMQSQQQQQQMYNQMQTIYPPIKQESYPVASGQKRVPSVLLLQFDRPNQDCHNFAFNLVTIDNALLEMKRKQAKSRARRKKCVNGEEIFEENPQRSSKTRLTKRNLVKLVPAFSKPQLNSSANASPSAASKKRKMGDHLDCNNDQDEDAFDTKRRNLGSASCPTPTTSKNQTKLSMAKRYMVRESCFLKQKEREILWNIDQAHLSKALKEHGGEPCRFILGCLGDLRDGLRSISSNPNNAARYEQSLPSIADLDHRLTELMTMLSSSRKDLGSSLDESSEDMTSSSASVTSSSSSPEIVVTSDTAGMRYNLWKSIDMILRSEPNCNLLLEQQIAAPYFWICYRLSFFPDVPAPNFHEVTL